MLTRRGVLAAAAALSLPESVMASEADDMSETLISSAAQGNVAGVLRLLDDGANVNARDRDNRTALHHAVEGQHIPTALALIRAGADVNASDGASIDHTPYLIAGARGYAEILREMLDHGADLASTNGYGGTALIPASEKGYVEAVRLLIDAGTDLDHVNRLGWTALLEAILLSDGGPGHQKIVRMLLEGGADPKLADRDGVTPLTHAEARGYEEIAALLKAHGG